MASSNQDDGRAEDDSEAGLEIPASELSEDALNGVIEDFVLREGTEYGARDYSLDEKREQVRRQLERGEAVIVFDPETGTVSIAVRT